MNRNNFFEIQTLSECHPKLRSRTRLRDPFSDIYKTIEGLIGLFGHKKLEMADLDKVFPGAGYWTTALKTRLLQNIAWVDDKLQFNIDLKMKAFINEVFAQTFCQSERSKGCFVPYYDTFECPECTQKFYDQLQKEKLGGGGSPNPVFGENINWQMILLIGGGILLVSVLSKKNKHRK